MKRGRNEGKEILITFLLRVIKIIKNKTKRKKKIFNRALTASLFTME